MPPSDTRKGVHWVRPNLVAQVEYAGWTDDMLIRQATFQGLREDKTADEAILDPTTATNHASAFRSSARR